MSKGDRGNTSPDQGTSDEPVAKEESMPMAAAPVALPEDVPMPPRRTVRPRVQLNVRLDAELHERFRTFCRIHEVTLQDAAEMAVDEFLRRRGA